MSRMDPVQQGLGCECGAASFADRVRVRVRVGVGVCREASAAWAPGLPWASVPSPVTQGTPGALPGSPLGCFLPEPLWDLSADSAAGLSASLHALPGLSTPASHETQSPLPALAPGGPLSPTCRTAQCPAVCPRALGVALRHCYKTRLMSPVGTGPGGPEGSLGLQTASLKRVAGVWERVSCPSSMCMT